MTLFAQDLENREHLSNLNTAIDNEDDDDDFQTDQAEFIHISDSWIESSTFRPEMWRFIYIETPHGENNGLRSTIASQNSSSVYDLTSKLS